MINCIQNKQELQKTTKRTVDDSMNNISVYLQLGPNVSIEAGAVIGPGVRVRESIVLSGAIVSDHSLVLHSIVGRGSHVGQWARVEGTPCDPNPNKPFAKMENPSLFNSDGRLNPSITILGKMMLYVSSHVFLDVWLFDSVVIQSLKVQ